MRGPFQLGPIVSLPGSRVWGTLDVGQAPDGQPVRCPVAVLNGIDDGPVLFVGGGVHGEELNGIEIARRIARDVDPRAVRGVLVAVPIQNVPSYEAFAYTTPWDGGDLGKSFPGDPAGSFTERLAHTLFEVVISRADIVIDVHSAMKWGEEYPQCIIIDDGTERATAAEAVARCFPVGAIVKVLPRDLPVHFGAAHDRSIFSILMHAGTPAVLVEIGEGGKLSADYIEIGVRGIVNAMKFLRMLDGPPERYPEPFVAGAMLNVRSPARGLVYVLTRLGARVEAGEPVARLVDLPDRDTIIRSPAAGLVLRVMTAGMALPGDRIIVLGVSDR